MNWFCRRLLCLGCFICLLSVKAWSQLQLTLDEFLSMTLNEDADAMKLIDTQASINQIEYVLSYKSFLPNLSLSLNGPSYTKTISPITQPDGTVCYRRVNNMNESLSIGFSMPINYTGGSLSLQSSISAYEHFANGESTKSISMNYYRLSLSQPLSFYSENKWGKRLLKYSQRQKMIENMDAYADEKTECVRLFFSLVICQYKDSILKRELDFYEKLKARIIYELNIGRTIETELDEVELKCQELKVYISDNENDKMGKMRMASSQYGIAIDNIFLFESPDFPSLECNIDSAVTLSLAKLDAQYAYSSENQNKNIEKLKRSKWGTPSLSVNMGLSSSTTNFDDLKNQIGKDYGAGINFSISITGLSSSRNEIKKAMLQKEHLQIAQKLQSERLMFELQDDYSRYNSLKTTYQNNKSRELMLQKKLEAFMDKYRLHHVLFDDVEEVLSKLSQVRISLIENVRDAFLLKCNIEKKITY